MDIGAKIKRIRLSNQLTLEELANRSELTKGFLSQLERDLTSPSVATLENILEALGTNLKDFFSEDEDEQIVFSKDDFFENIQGIDNVRLRTVYFAAVVDCMNMLVKLGYIKI